MQGSAGSTRLTGGQMSILLLPPFHRIVIIAFALKSVHANSKIIPRQEVGIAVDEAVAGARDALEVTNIGRPRVAAQGERQHALEQRMQHMERI